MRHQHHHPEQQHDGPEIDRVHRTVEADRAGDHHQDGADNRGAGAVHTKTGRAADSDDDVGEEENEEGDQSSPTQARPAVVSRMPGTALRSLISSRNSIRVLALSRKAPCIALVTQNEFCFCTPR